MAKFTEKISLAELKKRMAEVREEALRQIELHEIALDNSPQAIEQRRQIVFQGDEAAFRFFLQNLFATPFSR